MSKSDGQTVTSGATKAAGMESLYVHDGEAYQPVADRDYASLAAVGQLVVKHPAKRLLDICGAAGGLLFLAPFLLLVALVIRLESKGPALFRQRRTGLDGREFVIFKFRSMRTLEDGGKVIQATRGDARITRVGAFLRRASIDELPQLLNVLRGDMSLVGPRPHAISHDEHYGSLISTYRQRFAVRPGLTGLAQVTGFRGETADLADMEGRIDRDIQYIRGWSLWLDIKILARTVILGIFDEAAY